jgi:hypothetical protein
VIVYGEAHPHAISGRELLSLSNNSLIHSVSEPRLDVAALLEAWTGRVSDLQASLASLSRRGGCAICPFVVIIITVRSALSSLTLTTGSIQKNSFTLFALQARTGAGPNLRLGVRQTRGTWWALSFMSTCEWTFACECYVLSLFSIGRLSFQLRCFRCHVLQLHLKSTLKAHKESRNALLDLKGGLEGDVNSISKSIQQLQVRLIRPILSLSTTRPHACSHCGGISR